MINRDKLKQVVVRSGQFVKFDVDVKGEPAPTLQWIFAGTPLEKNDRIKIDNDEHNTKLSIGDSIRKDTGIYTLVAENSVGRDEATVEVSILAKPGKPEGPMEVTNVHKEGCKVKWDKPKDDGGLPITGYVLEKMEVGTGKWSPAGKCDPEKNELDVVGLEQGKKYHFRVKAVNEEGEGEPLETDGAILAKNPFDPPAPPGLPELVDWNENMVKLKWDLPIRDGGSPITGYIIEMMDKHGGAFVKAAEVKGNVCQGVVNNLEEGNRYEFRVRAVNKAGQSEPSDSTKPHVAKARYCKFIFINSIKSHRPIASIFIFIFTVKPKIDRTNLQKVTIKVGLQVNLDVNVAGEPPPAITWTLKDAVSALMSLFIHHPFK